MSESTESAAPMQFSLREIFIATTVISVILAISRIVGGLGLPDIGVFLVAAASILLATSRLFTWLGAGALFGVTTAVLTMIASRDPQAALLAGVAVSFFFAFAGAPLAIAKARGLHMRRWFVSGFGILTVATAITPADPISTMLVYVPLQLAMLGYVFFARDGAAPETPSEPDQA